MAFPTIRSRLADNFRQHTYLGYLAIARILVGYHFINVSSNKLARGFLSGESLPQQLSRVAADPLSWHRAFIENVVLTNPVFFSYLVGFGELAIGISLVTGCLVRIASCFGAFHNLNIYLAVAYAQGGAQLGLNRIFIFLHLLFVAASAGRSFGLDGWLKKKFPRCWLF
ncbi:MAG: DoxX family protein [Acidobacteria bacterium]|nr:DoxX family protein [Acidobacteriota bacterium]